MCGILALLARDGRPFDPGLTERMRDSMAHRGPDDIGLRIDGCIALAHRRLSIVDLSKAGHQPMCNEDGTIWIVFNGEIYNFVELADELTTRGHRFRSRCDTEVIVHLYEEHGFDCLRFLRGMFGFALWDGRRQVLFVARDRIGIKPLYYRVTPETFACASEIKALLEDPSVPRRVDYTAMADYVFAGQFLAGKTPFAGVHELLPGHYLAVTREGTTVSRYWKLEFRYDASRPWGRTVEQAAALLDDAVRLHCRSDAPVGCHLSGGLDSSAVTSLAARHRPGISAFAIRFDGRQDYYDETRYARAVAAASGARYVQSTPGAEDLWQLLSSLVWHMDTPLFGSGAFSYYTVSRLAARTVKVTLTGHGGDEVFAGYPAQFDATFGTTSMFASLVPAAPRASLLERAARSLRRNGPAGVWQAAKVRYRAMARPAPPRLEDRWVRLHCGLLPSENPCLGRDFLTALDGYSPLDDYLTPLRDAPTAEILDRCLYHDLVSYLPSLLQQEDRVSMALSIESRVPLLDHRIVEHLATVVPDQKVRGREPKAVLRAAVRGTVPDLVLNRRDKVPFAVPLDAWFNGPLWPFIRELLTSPRARERGIFRPAIRDVARSAPDLWARINVELWHRIFIDRDPAYSAGLVSK